MMEFLDPSLAPYISLMLVAGMFVLFARETYPVEVVATGGAALMLILGMVPTDAALGIFANPAPWTIAAMFILSGGLVRTGALKALSETATHAAGARPGRTLGLLTGTVLTSSAFINNTPVVVALIPVATQLARKLGISASKLLIPLSYTAILGGMCTLIGTSTNLLVAGVARESGLAPFSMFEITPLALILAATGMLYLYLAAPYLLPDRHSLAQMLADRSKMRFFAQAMITDISPLIGKAPDEIPMLKRSDMRLVDVLRGDESLRRNLETVRFEQGDMLVLRTSMGELLSLKDENGIELASGVSSDETTTVETLITPGCRLVGSNLGKLRLRRRYGVYVLAVHRRDENIGRNLDRTRIAIGDTLLIEGTPEDIERLARDVGLVNIAAPTEQPFRRTKAPLVVAALTAVVALSALGIMPIFAAAFIAVAFILVTRCIDSDEAISAIDGQLMLLILAMLVVGEGLVRSGAVDLLASTLAPLIAGLPPFLMLWALFAMTSLLTELVSNAAVAVALTPVAISLATTLGLDPRPFVIVVMIAASASFATPIGYQTNTLVYGPGGYRFADFLRIGTPLNIGLGLLASLLIPLFWPL